MTNEKALEGFEKLLKDIEPDNHLFVGTINPEFVEAAIKALEKQIPKKKINAGGWNVCPTCGHWPIQSYCNGCGQRIDWTEG